MNEFFGQPVGILTKARADALYAALTNVTATPTASKIPLANGSGKLAAGWLSNQLPVYNVKDYGAIGDGSTDDYTAVFAAITAAQLVGGTVYFPAGTYRINSQIIIPNDGVSIPSQRPLKFIGDGALFNGRGGGIYGGTILDLRYSSTGAKIETRGLGTLEIEGITVTDLSSGGAVSSTPFFFISNTSFFPHDMAVVGNPSKANSTCDQDAFILGGTTAGLYDGSANGSFQGYGTVIEKCYFGRIRRGVYLRCSANAVVIQNNTWWSTCGAPSTSYAAIEFDPTSPQSCIGNVVSNNLIEVVGYYYGIKAAGSSNNSFIANNFYDPTTVVAYYRFETTAQFNIIIAGYSDDTKPLISDNGSNTVINSHQTQISTFGQLVRFTKLGSGGAEGVRVTGNIALAGGASATFIQPATDQAEGAALLSIARSAVDDVNPGGSVFVFSQSGSISIFNSAGAEVDFTNGGKTWQAVGSGGEFLIYAGTGGSNVSIRGAGIRLLKNSDGTTELIKMTSSPASSSKGALRFTGTGPLIVNCTGTPEGAVVAPIGSLALRDDGGANTSLYVKESGVGNTGWVAK